MLNLDDITKAWSHLCFEVMIYEIATDQTKKLSEIAYMPSSCTFF